MYVGIDVGAKGGVCLLDDEGILVADRMPTVKGKFDATALAGSIRLLKRLHEIRHVCIEGVSAMPGQGVTSMFSFGYSAGVIEGVVSALELSYSHVRPQTWQKVMFEGIKGDDSKQRALFAVKKLFPDVPIIPPGCRVAHDGIVDAILIAEYARRTFK